MLRQRILLITLLIVLFAGLSTVMAEGRSTGLVFADESQYRSIPLASPPLMGELPSRADLQKYFPTPGDQGDQASCVGWSVAYGVKTYQEGIERGWNINSSDHQFSPSYVYNQLAYPPGNRYGGSAYVDAFNILTEQGVVPVSDFTYNEYDCTAQPSAATRSRGGAYRIATWRRVNVMDTSEMKAQIASGFPIMLGIMVDDYLDLLGPGEVYSSYSGYNTGGHAVVAIGFDDSKNAFKIFNSWGTGWADGGVGWISYDAMKQISVEGYVCQDLIVHTPDDISYDTYDYPDPVEPDYTDYSPDKTTYVDTYNPDIYTTDVGYPYADIMATNVIHNLDTPYGYGMAVTLDGALYNCYGGSGQVVLHFIFSDGTPLYATSTDWSDYNGNVAAATVSFDVTDNMLDFSGTQLYIPYWALNLADGYYHEIAVVPVVYVNNFDVGIGEPWVFYVQM